MLKIPMGELIPPNELKSDSSLSLIGNATLVITVGDRVTQTIHELGRVPDVQIIDMKERRKEREAPLTPYQKLIKVRNPAGTITKEAIDGISTSFKQSGKTVRVLVEGEEDLLAIPAIVKAPSGSILYYGQPKQGIVAVRVDERAKKAAKQIMKEMK
jgi:uncharacterized protein (UPF0218 family)